MPYDVKKSQKYLALQLRRQGRSYSEIQKELALPKSTLSLWLKKIKLDDREQTRLLQKRKEIAHANVKLRAEAIARRNDEVTKRAEKDVTHISKRELWLMGVMLFWSTGGRMTKESVMQKGVSFTSSDPALIKVFLVWLKRIGGLENSEISFSIYSKQLPEERERTIGYWSRATEFSRQYFSHYYIQKSAPAPVDKKRTRPAHAKYGVLKISVKASSLLARQINGWIQGIRHELI